MAQLIDIQKVTISQRTLSAEIRIGEGAPHRTADDLHGTGLIADLMPGLASHACYGDGGAAFGEVMSDTELAHLLEHVTVELLARTNRAGSISAGQTRAIDGDGGLYELRFACPDDVLVAGALSSASWVIDWAYSGGGEPEPDVDAIAQGLVALIDGLDGTAGEPEPEPETMPEPEPAPAPEPEPVDPDATIISAPVVADDLASGSEPLDQPEAVFEPQLAAEPEPESASEPEDAIASGDLDESEEDDPWKGGDMPASRFVR